MCQALSERFTQFLGTHDSMDDTESNSSESFTLILRNTKCFYVADNSFLLTFQSVLDKLISILVLEREAAWKPRMVSNPRSSTCQVCDFGDLLTFSEFWFPYLQNGSNIVIFGLCDHVMNIM